VVYHAASYIGAPVLVSPDGIQGLRPSCIFRGMVRRGLGLPAAVSTGSSILDDTKYKLNVLVGM